MTQSVTNHIDESARIDADISIGSYNYIGRNVVISGFKGRRDSRVEMGDCNFIHDNTRILLGPEGLRMGDWNVLHNSMLLMGEKRLEIGHNCWFGQNTILDSTGGLYIGNGVRVGMYSQIWTHVASGELIEGCILFAMRETRIEDDVWLVGTCIVGSGLTLGRRSICLIGSLLTKNTEPGKTYGGAPAREVTKLNFWREVTPEEKLAMMHGWVQEFAQTYESPLEIGYKPTEGYLKVASPRHGEEIFFVASTSVPIPSGNTVSYFNLITKQYRKRLTELERSLYRYLYNHKARFIPLS